MIRRVTIDQGFRQDELGRDEALANDWPDENLSVAGLLSHLEHCRQLKTCYLFGGLGRLVTREKVRLQARAYPKSYPMSRCRHLVRLAATECVYGFDCSGLLKSYWLGGVGAPNYASAMDLNAWQMLTLARQRGPMKRLPEVPGLGLWMPGHVGAYIGNGRIIESTLNKQFGDGVVETRIADRPWEFWFRLPFIRYED